MSNEFTDDDRRLADACCRWLPTAAPDAIADLPQSPALMLTRVSSGFYGIARAYGSLRLQEFDYLYVATQDACIRLDVLRRYAHLHTAAA